MADLKVNFDVRFSPAMFRWGLASLLVTSLAGELSSESVTLTTYYPAPSGVYTQMITTSKTFLARDAGGYVEIATTVPPSASTKLAVMGGNVGIQTTAPANPLQVYETAVGGTNGIGISGTGIYNAYGYQIVQANANDWLRINQNNSWPSGTAAYGNWAFGSGGVSIGTWGNQPNGQLYVTSRIGVANSAPSYPLDVNGNARANSYFYVQGPGGGVTNGFADLTYGGGWYMQDTSWIRAYGDKNVWTNTGLIANQAGFSAGYGGASPNTGGGIITTGRIGSGTNVAYASVDVAGDGVVLSRQGGCGVYTYVNGITNCPGGYYATMTGGFYAQYAAAGGNAQPPGQVQTGANDPWNQPEGQGTMVCCPNPGGGAYW